MEEKTKAEQLIDVAAWVKKQSPSFMKNFKSMNAIIKFYMRLPSDYDRRKSITQYVYDGLKNDSYTFKKDAERVALITHTLFRTRYFNGGPAKYVFDFGLQKCKDGYEVWCSPKDRCSIYNDFNPQDLCVQQVRCDTIGDVRRALDKLTASLESCYGKDYEACYRDSLSDALKKKVKATSGELKEGILISCRPWR